MYKLASDMLNRADRVALADFAAALPAEFPTVEAKEASWFTYARSICQWMDYAGLVRLDRDGISRVSDEATARKEAKLLSGAVPVRVRSAFPGSSAGPAVQILQHLANPASFSRPSNNGFRASVRDLSLLGVIELDARDRIALADDHLLVDGEVDRARLRTVVEGQPGMREAFESLEQDPATTPRDLGAAQRARIGADWADQTTASVGKFIRSWARACGIKTTLKRKP
jgi:hypothetical protein